MFDISENQIWIDNITHIKTIKPFLKPLLFILNDYYNLKFTIISMVNYVEYSENIEQKYLNYSSEF